MGTLKKASIWVSCACIILGACGGAYGIDHSLFITSYEGAKTCAVCHAEQLEAIKHTVHYKFESPILEDYLFDEEGEPLEIERSGKFWKLCGFPTSLAQFNWTGSLADDSSTDYIDKPGGCGRCHIGIGVKPYTASGKTEIQDSEMYNVDCLVCHADNYSRKFYVAKMNGEPELNAAGSAVVLAVPKVDGELDFSSMLEAAQSVGKTKAEYCNRCHAAAGGGRSTMDNMEYSFKRGSIYAPETDVHAAAGMSCSACHYAGDHKTKRSVNNDIYAYDTTPPEHQMCIDCHTDTPHYDAPMYNIHTSFVTCTACHATSVGGAKSKDFSAVIPKDENDPLSLFGIEVQHYAEGEFQMDYRWFNGEVHGEIKPAGDRATGMIYPFKPVTFNQTVDENGHPVPLKWGLIFKKGDVAAAAAAGLTAYADMYNEELGAQTGLPPVPGEFVAYKESSCVFSISHGITKTDALRCKDCHSQNSVLDFTALGYSEKRSTHLATIDVDDSTTIMEWSLYTQ